MTLTKDVMSVCAARSRIEPLSISFLSATKRRSYDEAWPEILTASRPDEISSVPVIKVPEAFSAVA